MMETFKHLVADDSGWVKPFETSKALMRIVKFKMHPLPNVALIRVIKWLEREHKGVLATPDLSRSACWKFFVSEEKMKTPIKIQESAEVLYDTDTDELIFRSTEKGELRVSVMDTLKTRARVQSQLPRRPL